MRRGLAAYVDAAPLRLADQPDALFRRDVAHMVAAAGLGRQLEVPRDLAPFALGADAFVPVRAGVGPVVDVAASQQAVVLAVGDDQLAQRLCALHGLAHQAAVLHAVPVVGEGDRPVGKVFHIGDFLSPFAHGDGGIGIDGDTGVALDDLGLAAQVFRTVRHGIEVRHGAHRGVSAVRCGQRPAFYGLLI